MNEEDEQWQRNSSTPFQIIGQGQFRNFKIVGVQEEKCKGAGRKRSLK